MFHPSQLFMNVRIVLMPIMACVFFSCAEKGDDPTPPPTRTQLLSAKKWQGKSSIIEGQGQPTVDIYALTPLDKRDDFQRFDLPNTFVYDEGPTKFRAIDPQIQLGLWALSNNDTQLTISFRGYTNTYFIEELTSTSLKTRLEQLQGNGIMAVTTTSFIAIN